MHFCADAMGLCCLQAVGMRLLRSKTERREITVSWVDQASDIDVGSAVFSILGSIMELLLEIMGDKEGIPSLLDALWIFTMVFCLRS